MVCGLCCLWLMTFLVCDVLRVTGVWVGLFVAFGFCLLVCELLVWVCVDGTAYASCFGLPFGFG